MRLIRPVWLADAVEQRDGHSNNFDIIRLVAASLVLISHAFPISGDTSRPEPLAQFTLGQTTFGAFAVEIFFFISGFLVTRSYLRSRSLVRFATARAFRIVPGLLVVALISILIMGPLVTVLGTLEYFEHGLTRKYLYNAILHVQYFLPGVFTDHPNGAVNGSLWSLEIEGIMYLILPFFLLFSGRFLPMLGPILVAGLIVGHTTGMTDVTKGFYTYYIVHLGQFFGMGMVAYIWRRYIPLAWPLALIGILAILAGAGNGTFTLMMVLCGGYVLLWIAYALPKIHDPITRYGDISYGVYIYAFPVQQLAVMTAFGQTWYGNILIALPLTLICGALSWHLVEKPAMSYRKAVSDRIRQVLTWILGKLPLERLRTR